MKYSETMLIIVRPSTITKSQTQNLEFSQKQVIWRSCFAVDIHTADISDKLGDRRQGRGARS